VWSLNLGTMDAVSKGDILFFWPPRSHSPHFYNGDLRTHPSPFEGLSGPGKNHPHTKSRSKPVRVSLSPHLQWLAEGSPHEPDTVPEMQ
jgi:hypothetical protein